MTAVNKAIAPKWKSMLLGLGLGVALTLVAGRLNADYWHNRVQEGGQIHMIGRSAMGGPSAKLLPPPVPGSRILAEEMQQLENVTVRPLGGKAVTLAELRGKPVFLNVWETSCIPCVLELPSLKNLAASMRDEPVDILLVAFEDEARVRQFVGAQRELPVYVADERDTPKVLLGRGVPQTYILDRNGAVVFHHAGAADWDSDDVRAFLRGLTR